MTLARDPGTCTLAERHLIRTPVCFLDETGLLHKPADLCFGVGMIKGSPASDLTRMMRNWRDRHHYYDEVKFHGLNKGVLTYYLELASRGVDGIQLGDLLLGAIAYDCKLQVGLIPPKGTSPKRVFVQAMRDHLGVRSLAAPFRSGKLNIAFHGRASA